MTKLKPDIGYGQRFYEECMRIFSTPSETVSALRCSRSAVYEWANGLTPSIMYVDRLRVLGGDLMYILTGQRGCDLAEVVRCADCRHCKEHPTSDMVLLCTNETWNTEYHPLVVANSYCHKGERRNNA